MAARLVWEQSFSGGLARDSYGTGKSRAQVRLRKFQELTQSKYNRKFSLAYFLMLAKNIFNLSN